MIKFLFSSTLRIFGLLALVAFVLLAILKLLPETAQTPQPVSPNNAYPPPVNTPTTTLTPTSVGYPPPHNFQTTSLGPTVTIPTATLNPYLFSSAAQATEFYLYIHRTPSPSEIAAQATYIAQRANIGTQISVQKTNDLPDYQSPSFPVKSEADLPNVLYNDIPMYTSSFHNQCFSVKNPGLPSLVHSLDPKKPDYYILPFYKDNKVCALSMITVTAGLGTVHGIGGVFGDTYPQVTANEAINLVEKKTGMKVVGQPYLAYQLIYEDTDPFSPFWNVQTSDGQTFYVIFIFGSSEDGSINKNVTIINSKEVTILH